MAEEIWPLALDASTGGAKMTHHLHPGYWHLAGYHDDGRAVLRWVHL